MDLSCCFLCKERQLRYWFTKETPTGKYPIVRCDSCKSAFVWPRPDSAAISCLYSDTHPHPSSHEKGSYWPPAEADFERMLDSFGRFANGKVFFDVGAGFGVASDAAKARGFIIRACEPSAHSRAEFKARVGFEADPCFFDASYAERNRNQADGVMLSHVLEHILDPEQFIRDASAVLQPDGVIMMAVPHFGSLLTLMMGKRDFFVTPPFHLNYFSEKGIRSLLQRAGYQVVSRCTSSKVNLRRYSNFFGKASYPVNYCGYGLLKVSEFFNRGIVLNICARRMRT